MPTKLWHRASLAALLAPVLLLAACSGQTGGDSSSPPPAESTADPSPSTLPSAPASTPPVLQPPSIAEQFIQRVSLPDAQPSVLLEDLHVSLSRTEAPEQADAMLRVMDAYLAGQLSKVQQTYEAESVQNALSALTFPITEAQFDGLPDADVRELVTKTVADGYKLTAVEGFIFPVIDYDDLLVLAEGASPAMQAYLAIMAAESNAHTAGDGGLAITREELLSRTLRSEAYLQKYADTPESGTVETMFGNYLTMYLLGLPNSPVIDESNSYRVLPDIASEWRQTAADHADTVSGMMTQRLLDLLDKYDGAMYKKGKDGQREDIPEMKAFRDGFIIVAKAELQHT